MNELNNHNQNNQSLCRLILQKMSKTRVFLLDSNFNIILTEGADDLPFFKEQSIDKNFIDLFPVNLHEELLFCMKSDISEQSWNFRIDNDNYELQINREDNKENYLIIFIKNTTSEKSFQINKDLNTEKKIDVNDSNNFFKILESLLNTIIKHFFKIDKDNFSKIIEFSLGQITQLIDFDHCLLINEREDSNKLRITIQWSKYSMKFNYSDYDFKRFNYFNSELKQNKMFIVHNAKFLPDNAQKERSFLKNQKLESILCFELSETNNLSGYLVFLKKEPNKTVFKNEIQLLKSFSEILSRLLSNLKKDALLISEKELSDKASKNKTDFLLYTSHRIRTPLNNILGFIQILKRNNQFAAEEAKIFSFIESDLQQITEVINNVSDIHSIENKQFKINKTLFSVEMMIESISKMINLINNNEKISLQFISEAKLDKTLNSDMDIINDSIRNIFNFFIRNFKERSYIVRITSHKNNTRIIIINRNVSIKANIFNQFSVSCMFNTINDLDNHSLISLCLSNLILSLINAELYFYSSKSSGSVFWINIPDEKIIVPSYNLAKSLQKHNLKTIRIAIIDRNYFHFKAMQDLLQDLNIELKNINSVKEFLNHEDIANYSALFVNKELFYDAINFNQLLNINEKIPVVHIFNLEDFIVIDSKWIKVSEKCFPYKNILNFDYFISFISRLLNLEWSHKNEVLNNKNYKNIIFNMLDDCPEIYDLLYQKALLQSFDYDVLLANFYQTDKSKNQKFWEIYEKALFNFDFSFLEQLINFLTKKH